MAAPFLSANWYRIAALKPKLRAHSQIHRHRYRNHAWYVLQDHATGRSHRFTSAAYVFIGNMDGHRTVDEIWTEIVVQLDENAPTQDEIIQLLSQLHAADMLQMDSQPDPAELFERFTRQRRSILKRNLKNPLSMTIPLWDPDRFLDRTLWLVRPCISMFGLFLWMAVVLPACVAAGLYWGELTQNISDRVLSAQGLFLMALVYPVVKMIHELAHAYMTKVFGGEVHEMGVMFLVFYPIPYVDASTSSVFKDKWERAAVGAAGMGAELFVAALAMYLWLAIEPGIIRACAYDAMLIAGVSTLIVNGNPLLRFDGYYILSDLVEIPNLAQRSAKYLTHIIGRYVFGAETGERPVSDGERKWLLVFAPASFFYRMTVLFAIALFVANEYFVIGVLIAVWAFISAVIIPAVKGVMFVFKSERLRYNRGRAISITLTSLCGLAIFLFFIPFPLHTAAEGVIWLPDTAQVRAGTDGFVQRIVARPGSEVKARELLFESDEPLLETQIEVDRHKVQGLQARMLSQQFADRVQAEITRNELAQEQANLEKDLERAKRLVAKSSGAGTFLVPQSEDLPGRFFKQGELLGYVTPPFADFVRVIISQDDIDLVRNRVRRIEAIIPDRINERFAAAMVREVPAANGELPSKALGSSGGGRVAFDPRDNKGLKSLQRMFQFDLRLEPTPTVGFGSRVYVRFDHYWEPLGEQFYRRIRQLFLARLNV